MIIRALENTYVAEKTLRRKETVLLVKDSTEELVGRAETLHKDITLTVMNQLNSLSHSLELIRITDNLEVSHRRKESQKRNRGQLPSKQPL